MFFLKGDAKQIATQATTLKQEGFDVTRIDITAAVDDDYRLLALACIWDKKLPGWINYGVEFAECGIATNEEFSVVLEAFHPLGGRQ